MSVIERFEEKVSPCPASGCFLWIAAVDQRGYGRFGFRPHGEKNYRAVAAHRVAWELYVGPVPDGMEVCHHCDNPMCVRIAHLFLGTHLENMHDRDNKGRNIGWSAKTHCAHGHEFSGDNLYIAKDGARRCKACSRRSQAE